MMKKIKYLIITFILLLGNKLPVFANDNIVDFTRKGSVSIILKESTEEMPVENAELTIFKIADVEEDKNNLSYRYVVELNKCNADLTNLENPNLVNEILECVNEKEISSFKKNTNNDGIVNFSNLDLGLYLIMQTNDVIGYSKIDSFLVNIPKSIDNKWNYDIEAIPKIDIIKLFDLTVEKVWGVSGDNNIPDSVTIELLKNNKVIDTVKLSKENNWMYTWKQIEKSDEYLINEINIPIGYTATYRKEGDKFVATNTKTLIQTGQNTWLILMSAILGLIFITIGFATEKRNKYE